MTSSSKRNPFDVVAEALKCTPELLSNESGMYKDHGWDSFGHVSIITAIEEALGIRVANEDVIRYTTMRSIVELFNQHLGVYPK